MTQRQPHILVVDDSEAILAFVRAVLSKSYQVSTARNGREGLDQCRKLHPDLVVLDLSMPELDGEGVLAQLQSDSELSAIPVLILSSEQARAEACLARGAWGYMVKPARADELVVQIERALASARTRAARGGMAVLPLGIGTLDLVVALADVRHVLLQPATRPLPGGPSYLAAFVELLGEAVCVLDLAARFGVPHDRGVIDRKLVIVEQDGVKLALCADRVLDPEEIAPADVQPITPELARGDDELLGALRAMVRTSRGTMAVVRAHALLSRGLLRALPELVRGAAA